MENKNRLNRNIYKKINYKNNKNMKKKKNILIVKIHIPKSHKKIKARNSLIKVKNKK